MVEPSLARSSDQSMTSNIIPRLSISDSRLAACTFHCEVSRIREPSPFAEPRERVVRRQSAADGLVQGP